MTQASPFEVLAEQEAATPRCTLEAEYGAALRLGTDRVAVNFVSTIDGIVSFGLRQNDSRAVGGGFAADRVLMAMLRAVAGVIVVGAGTLRATLNHQWTPQALAPDRAADLAQLRAAASLPDTLAPLLVVSSSGRIPADADAVARPATAAHVVLPGGLFDARDPALRSPAVQAAAGVVIDPAAVVAAALGLSGGAPVLCEGGPHLLGSLLLGGVPLDLFLSVAPQLAGRVGETDERRSLVEGVALPPFARAGTLRSVRRAGDNLLLRYAIDAA